MSLKIQQCPEHWNSTLQKLCSGLSARVLSLAVSKEYDKCQLKPKPGGRVHVCGVGLCKWCWRSMGWVTDGQGGWTGRNSKPMAHEHFFCTFAQSLPPLAFFQTNQSRALIFSYPSLHHPVLLFCSLSFSISVVYVYRQIHNWLSQKEK